MHNKSVYRLIGEIACSNEDERVKLLFSFPGHVDIMKNIVKNNILLTWGLVAGYVAHTVAREDSY